MKKLLTFVIVSILCLSLAACGSQSSATPAADSSDVSVPAPDTSAPTETESEIPVEEKNVTLEDWCAENPDELEAMAAGAENVEVSAEGNTLIYKFDMTYVGDEEMVKSDTFKELLVETTVKEEAAQIYIDSIKDLEDRSGISDITFTVLYTYEDEPVASVSFTRDGVVENTDGE